MRSAALILAIMLSWPAAAIHHSSPVNRYNAVAENIYLLERCGGMTPERRAWLGNVRGHTMRAAGWNAAEAAAHDVVLKREFEQRYAVMISKERCDALARTTDHERATTVLAP